MAKTKRKTVKKPRVSRAIEKAPIDSLTPDPENVRKHSDRNIQAIKASLERFGQQKPIVVDQDGVVVAGNGTLTAAKALGWTHIEVVRTSLSGDERAAFAIADNRTAELAEWDYGLADVLAALQAEDDALVQAAGFDESELVQILDDRDIPDRLDLGEPPASATKNADQIAAIKAQRKRGNEGVVEKNDTERYLIVVFPDRARKEAVLQRLGLPADERYVPSSSVVVSSRQGWRCRTCGGRVQLRAPSRKAVQR